MLRKFSNKASRAERRQNRRKAEAGFSLTEVLVAVFIIGLLSVVAIGPVIRALSTGKVAGVKKELGILESSLADYYLAMGEFPSEQDGLKALYELPGGSSKSDRYPKDGFLQKEGFLTDPWGNPYQYRYPGEHGKFDIYSLGADGRPDGEDDDADIGNWQE